MTIPVFAKSAVSHIPACVWVRMRSMPKHALGCFLDMLLCRKRGDAKVTYYWQRKVIG